MIASNPNYMAGGFEKIHFRSAGDTLWFTGSSTGFHFRLGDQIVVDPRPVSETRTKLVRVR